MKVDQYFSVLKIGHHFVHYLVFLHPNNILPFSCYQEASRYSTREAIMNMRDFRFLIVLAAAMLGVIAGSSRTDKEQELIQVNSDFRHLAQSSGCNKCNKIIDEKKKCLKGCRGNKNPRECKKEKCNQISKRVNNCRAENCRMSSKEKRAVRKSKQAERNCERRCTPIEKTKKNCLESCKGKNNSSKCKKEKCGSFAKKLSNCRANYCRD